MGRKLNNLVGTSRIHVSDYHRQERIELYNQLKILKRTTVPKNEAVRAKMGGLKQASSARLHS